MTMDKLKQGKFGKVLLGLGAIGAVKGGLELITDNNKYASVNPPQQQEYKVTAEDSGSYPTFVGSINDVLESANSKAYAGGLSEQEKKERREANLPKELQGDIFDYFDGEIYKGNSPDFPKDRWNFSKDLGREGDELKQILEVPDLYQFIGKHLEEQYKNGQLVFIGFNPENKSRIGVSFQIDGEYYGAFKEINEKQYSLLQNYNKL